MSQREFLIERGCNFMDKYKFKWLESDTRSSEPILFSATERTIQNYAESILGRNLSNTELGLVPGLIIERLEALLEGNEILKKAIQDAEIITTIIKEQHNHKNTVRK